MGKYVQVQSNECIVINITVYRDLYKNTEIGCFEQGSYYQTILQAIMLVQLTRFLLGIILHMDTQELAD